MTSLRNPPSRLSLLTRFNAANRGPGTLGRFVLRNREVGYYGAVHLCATNFVQTPNPLKNHNVTLTLGLAPKSSGPARPFGARKIFCTQQ